MLLLVFSSSSSLLISRWKTQREGCGAETVQRKEAKIERTTKIFTQTTQIQARFILLSRKWPDSLSFYLSLSLNVCVYMFVYRWWFSVNSFLLTTNDHLTWSFIISLTHTQTRMVRTCRYLSVHLLSSSLGVHRIASISFISNAFHSLGWSSAQLHKHMQHWTPAAQE